LKLRRNRKQTALTDGGTVDETGSSTLVVQRRRVLWRDRLRAYAVLIDGVGSGEVRAGDERRIEVSPGSHVVQGKIDWASSNPIQVEIAPGATCVVALGPRWVLPFGLLLMFWPRRYLRLSEAAEVQQGA
jgi:hypothetical protein